ncbi:5'-nucleotidase C-terminal domain-containing protein [Polaribacter sp. OB-PA-B3]
MKFINLICLFLLLTACKKTENNLTKITAKNIAIDSTIASSAKIDSIIAPYSRKMIGEMEKVLSYAPYNFTKKSENRQSNLGNLMADMCYEMANAIFKDKTGSEIDFSMFNNGGLRAIISKGNVTQEDAFNLMPFENELVVVQLSGAKIEELVTYFIDSKSAHPLSKEVALHIKKDAYSLQIKGQNFDKNKTYNVLTSDYLQGGGDRMNFFKNPIQLTKIDYKVRDAIIHYFQQTDTIKATIDNRVTL